MRASEKLPAGDVQLTVSVSFSQIDPVIEFLAQELPAGFQELESTDSRSLQLRFFLKEPATRRFRLKWEGFYHATFGIDAPVFDTAFIAETDWQARFRQETKAVIVAGSILVRPTWVERDTVITPAITTEIVIDPKMAFGVGSHATTTLAMCALKEKVKSGQRVADIGCGSLILSILAAKLGAGFVKAVDNDPLAFENSLENRRLNQVEDKVEVLFGSPELLAGENGSYDIVVANIISQILISLLDDMLLLLRHNGALILSGILESQAPEIESALQERGVTAWRKTQDGEWIGYTCLVKRN